jgi:hypothetical protein
LGRNASLGAVVGAGAGLFCGLTFNQVNNSEQSAYQQVYATGQRAPKQELALHPRPIPIRSIARSSQAGPALLRGRNVA